MKTSRIFTLLFFMWLASSCWRPIDNTSDAGDLGKLTENDPHHDGRKNEKHSIICNDDLNQSSLNKLFQEYPAGHRSKIQVKPDVDHGLARAYRTIITQQAQSGPNFSGEFTIVQIGCGAATSCVAVLNNSNGKVYFPAKLKSIEALLVDRHKAEQFETLDFRIDSNLVVAIGSPNERQKDAGRWLFIWNGSDFEVLDYTPAWEFCKVPKETRF